MFQSLKESGEKFMIKVLVEGPGLTLSGYGENTRLILRALRSRSDLFNIFLAPLNWGQTSWLSEMNDERLWLDDITTKMAQVPKQNLSFDVHIFVGIPSEFQKKASFGVLVTAGLETNRISDKWIPGIRMADMILVPSMHAKKSILNGMPPEEVEVTNSKIHVVPYAANFNAQPSEEFEFKSNFNFLVLAQLSPRKNIESAIQWFIEEFKDDPDAGLILKVNMAQNSTIDFYRVDNTLNEFLKRFKDRKCHVYLFHGDLNDEEMASLFCDKRTKAMICLGSEGFNLPAFEAAQKELPIIALNWSAHTEFLNVQVNNKNKMLFSPVDYDLLPVKREAIWPGVIDEGMIWAYPKSASFKSRIRSMKNHHGSYKKMAEELRENIILNYNEDKIYKNICELISTPFNDIDSWMKEIKNGQK